MEHLTLETFQEKVMHIDSDDYQGDLPIILDFYADWCQPCKALTPTLEELSKEYEGKVKIYKIDTEMEMELAQKFKIRSIPSVLFLSQKEKTKVKNGNLPKTHYIEVIESLI